MFIPVTGTGLGKVMFVFGDPADLFTEERSCCCCRLDDAGVGTVPRIHRIGWRLMDRPRRLLSPEGRGACDNVGFDVLVDFRVSSFPLRVASSSYDRGFVCLASCLGIRDACSDSC
jgi:hypothetical protein